jgi:hypothetical protein
MPDTTQVNVKLPVSQKREWETYVEENEEATSLSHLIRLSVQREINDESRRSPDVDLAADELDVDVELDSVHRRLDEFEETLAEVRDTVTAMETGQLADEDQIKEIADRIYETLPRRSAHTMEDAPELQPREVAQDLVQGAREWMKLHDCDLDDLSESQNWDFGLIEAYKRHFNVNDYTIQRVLERVEQMSSRVHVVTSEEYDVVFEME